MSLITSFKQNYSGEPAMINNQFYKKLFSKQKADAPVIQEMVRTMQNQTKQKQKQKTKQI